MDKKTEQTVMCIASFGAVLRVNRNHRRQEKRKPPQLSKRHFLCDAVLFTQINMSCFKCNNLLSGLYAFKGLHLLQATQKKEL